MFRITPRRVILLAIVAVGIGAFLSKPLNAQMKSTTDIRYVVFHKPGPNWKHGVPFRDQPGLQGHVDHYRKLLEAGKLSMGGPFLDDTSGGMAITAPGIAEAEIKEFAAADPTVQSGLLVFEVRPWLAALHK